MADYSVWDVFTDTRFGGNPLAVVTGEVPDDLMQTIAKEFGFSETTFVQQPKDSSHTARVRIFTPTLELAFAGHPTVGTALALHDAGKAGAEMMLELGVGPIPVTIADGRARFVTRVPLTEAPAPSPGALGACIGQSADAIRTDTHMPVFAGLGTEFVLAEAAGPATLATARPVVQAFRDAAGPDADRLALFLYLRDGDQIRARMFQPLGGITEDPATGSAAAALAAYLGKLDGRSQSLTIFQGVEMGRPSIIEAEVTVEDGTPVAVAIAGRAVKVMEGRLTL